MPYKRNDSAYWWISFKSATGKLVRRSSGTADYSAAKALEQQERAKAWKEKEMGVNPPRTFEEVIIPYLQHARQHQRSYETTVHRIKPLREYFAGRVINDLGGRTSGATERTDWTPAHPRQPLTANSLPSPRLSTTATPNWSGPSRIPLRDGRCARPRA